MVAFQQREKEVCVCVLVCLCGCVAGFFEMKMKYDESDNALIRASRAVTDKMTDLIGEKPLVYMSALNSPKPRHVPFLS